MSQVEGGRRTNTPSTNPYEVNQTQVNQIEVDETERQRLAAAFLEIYNKNVIDRKVLCDHIYGILLALMQNPVLMESPGDQFSVDREGRVRFTINLSPNKPNPTLALFPVETNVEFKANYPKHLEIQRQKLKAELDRYDLVKRQTLSIVQGFPDDSDVKKSILQAFNNVNTDLEQELRKIREQEVNNKRSELAKEIGDWLLNLLEQIEQGNST